MGDRASSMKRKNETTIGEGLINIGEGLINPRTGQSAHAFHTKVARWVLHDACPWCVGHRVHRSEFARSQLESQLIACIPCLSLA